MFLIRLQVCVDVNARWYNEACPTPLSSWSEPVFWVKFQSTLVKKEIHSDGWKALKFDFWFTLNEV